MPTLHWVGKEKVVNHHLNVPFRVLNKVSSFRAPEGSPSNSTDNRIIHGDNLEALKSLLPEFEGKVKCIYIDPPYNTGNEGWIYNDAVNDPKIKRWLGQVVGKEGEDLSRHDKWLCMMYPRLKLLHRLLSTDGVLFASIDRNELATFKLLLEEIFGAGNWVGEIIWRNVTDNNPTNISLEHEYVICFSKNKAALSPIWKSPYLDAKEKLIQVGQQLASNHVDKKKLQAAYTKWYKENKAEVWPFQDYKFIDSDGIYTGSRSVHNPGKEGYRYDVIRPTTKKACKQPLMGYRFPFETMQKLLTDDRILFGDDEKKLVELKLYVKDYKAKLSSVIELDGRTGTNELKSIFSESNRPFDYPKPSVLLEELLGFATNPGDIILDSFAGSGTTGHATLKLNSQDQGNRKFVLIELGEYADSITAERIRRVTKGFGQNDKAVQGLGGGFDYYTIGEPIFHSDDNLNEAVGTEAIRAYVAYSEGIPPDEQTTSENPHSPYLLGLNQETAWLFHYEPDRATCLDMDFLSSLHFGGATGSNKPATVIVYPITDREVKEYVRRIVASLNPEQIRDCIERDVAYVRKIKQKISKLADAHALKTFTDMLDVDRIVIQPGFKLPESITPSANASAIPKSLYVTEAAMGDFERRLINDIANLDSVQWWHRNLSRGKGFRINGFLNHYPDFIVKTKSGKVIALETKGDDRDNSDSELKLKLGKLWESKAGRDYRYMMVFDNNPIEGSERLSDALAKIRQL